MLENKVVQFRGKPLFQKARFDSMDIMQGEIKEFACFFYMTEGTMTSYDSRGLHQLSASEAVMKHCGNYVQKYIAEDGSSECEAVAVYLYPDLLKEIYKNEVPSFLKPEVENPMPRKIIGSKLIEQYIDSLSLYFDSPESLDEELGLLKLKELMLILLKSENYQSVRRLLSEIFAPIHIEFQQAIERNLFNNLSLEELAFITNMSLSTFKRTFKKVFSESPAKYIKNRRLEKAASLLTCGDDSITEIAFKSGFQDVTTFSANFHDKYDITPSKYKLNQSRI